MEIALSKEAKISNFIVSFVSIKIEKLLTFKTTPKRDALVLVNTYSLECYSSIIYLDKNTHMVINGSSREHHSQQCHCR